MALAKKVTDILQTRLHQPTTTIIGNLSDVLNLLAVVNLLNRY